MGKLIRCPICKGGGKVPKPKHITINKERVAKVLYQEGYSIRQIMSFLGYKSPKSVQDLLKKKEKNMSWHIELVATREVARAKVTQDSNLPIFVKECIASHLDNETNAPNGVHISGHGHVNYNSDSSPSCIELKVEPINIYTQQDIENANKTQPTG